MNPALRLTSRFTTKSTNLDANELIDEIEATRQYGANYHLLNSVAEYEPFVPAGKTGLRDYVRSKWCQRNAVSAVFEELIKEARFRYIFLSYNNEGLTSVEEVERIMRKYGDYDLLTKNYQRFKADKTDAKNHKADSTVEYLHVLEKS